MVFVYLESCSYYLVSHAALATLTLYPNKGAYQIPNANQADFAESLRDKRLAIPKATLIQA
jgi:hypothetical protein